MSSRAHVIQNYSFGSAHPRHRRPARYPLDADPIELPRTSVWRTSGGALATAVAFGAVVMGSVYAAYREPTPSMGETPVAPLSESWQPNDANLAQARVSNLLQGPAAAAREKSGASAEAAVAMEPDAAIGAAPSSSGSREVIVDDSALYPPARKPNVDLRPAGADGPAESRPTPYPNPATTPPEGIAPPEPVRAPSLAVEPENPYLDR